MPPDTTLVRDNEDVPVTKLRNLRVDEDVWQAAKESARAEGETVSAVLNRALRAYVADPQAFNAAVANIRGGRR